MMSYKLKITELLCFPIPNFTAGKGKIGNAYKMAARAHFYSIYKKKLRSRFPFSLPSKYPYFSMLPASLYTYVYMGMYSQEHTHIQNVCGNRNNNFSEATA